MKLTNSDCEQSHYTAPARTHSMNKWTKILSLAITIFDFKNDGE